MASQTQFKQQCPSCEAMVPIKDASLIGKKVDCPKCKYRFVVEDPGNLESDGRPATAVKEKPDGVKPGKAGDKGAKAKARARADADDEGDDDGKGKKKKAAGKKGGSMMLILGIVLALVALIGLIVGGILIFGGSSDSDSGSGSKSTQQQPKPNPPRTGGTTSGSNPTATGAPAGTGDGSTGGDASPAAATGPGAPVTNLLPNETQVVYSINVNKFMASTLGGAAFHSASGFQPATFRDGLGLPLEQMSRFLRAESLKSKWVFNIVHMFPKFSIKADAMKAKLGSQKGPKSPIKGQEYYLVAPNETLDSLSAVDLAAMFNPAAPAVKVGAAALAWHLYDEQTLVVGEVGQVEQFLQSGRQPTLRTQVSDRSSGGFGPMGFGPMGPMGMGPMGMGPMGMSSRWA